MQEASQVRRAAREAVGETEPERLRTYLSGVLDEGSMVPGVLVVLSARAASEGGEYDDEGGDDALANRAAGVQLIYDGLRLTRTLADEEPWTDETADRTEADIAILAADVLVARGFFLLARTECAARAVETVRRFGRDQTGRHEGTATEADSRDPDRNLEADALDLAVRCGVTAAGEDVPSNAAGFASDLAGSTDDGFPASADFLSASATDALAALVDGRTADVSEGVPSVTDG